MSITASALDLIKLSLKMAGVLAVGQTPLAEDVNDAFNLLNSMLASWNQSRWLIYHLIDVSRRSTGAHSYSVGPGGDFDTPRPDRLQSAYVRQRLASQPSDYPLVNIETFEEYAQINLKNLQSFPSACFYDPTLGLGTLYVWPIPNDQYDIHLILKGTLGQFNTLDDLITFPPEYYEAIVYNLVGRINLLYQLPMNPGVVALASGALNIVRAANHRVPNLKLPGGLTRNSSYDIHGSHANTDHAFVFTLDQDLLG